ncbi:membrane steroid-binding protein 2 [Brassica napus]|uniref:(rape) hypothetical protein n=1 Tax=Brassica napus TaxID=3708 RepID=A0A816IN57_BRANA|nr:membrane steroid-binding protein 2 [Brassica napus]CAF1707884.1 unnamed protein product [Brassica napus]
MMVVVVQLWETLKETITAYTGLSPAAFFTVVALAFAIYQVVSGFFASPEEHRPRSTEVYPPSEPLPPPVQLGEITEEELKQYDGSDSKKPLLMAIKGQIYDVSQSRVDASRALAKMSFEENDLTGDISGLGPFELDALQDWEYKFMSKYVKVGTIQKKDEEGKEKTEDSTNTGEEASATTVGETSRSVEEKTIETTEKKDVADGDAAKEE